MSGEIQPSAPVPKDEYLLLYVYILIVAVILLTTAWSVGKEMCIIQGELRESMAQEMMEEGPIGKEYPLIKCPQDGFKEERLSGASNHDRSSSKVA